ncbi:MAG: hypothetical protein V3U20_06320, partial [Thermoplasmata archaeon]
EHIILENLMFPTDRPVTSNGPVVLHTKSTGMRQHPGETVPNGTVSASPNHQSDRLVECRFQNLDRNLKWIAF